MHPGVSAGESWARGGGSLPTSAEGFGNVFLQKSIFDRIQEDFPRTPSPVVGAAVGVIGGGAGRWYVLYESLNVSRVSRPCCNFMLAMKQVSICTVTDGRFNKGAVCTGWIVPASCPCTCSFRGYLSL